MNVTRVDKKQEAIKRMEVLDIFGETINQFERECHISYSEPPMGVNYWLNDEQEKVVREFERRYDALVFFGVRSYTNFGILDSYLYVSDYEEEWEMDNIDLKDGYVYAYVYNHDVPEHSEIGLIQVQPRFGGLVRIH